MTLNLKDLKLHEKMMGRIKGGVAHVAKFIDGEVKYFFNITAQPPVKFKNKTIGKVIYVDPVDTVSVEIFDGKSVNYIFNAKYREFIKI